MTFMNMMCMHCVLLVGNFFLVCLAIFSFVTSALSVCKQQHSSHELITSFPTPLNIPFVRLCVLAAMGTVLLAIKPKCRARISSKSTVSFMVEEEDVHLSEHLSTELLIETARAFHSRAYFRLDRA
jgi:hypothetical protein